MLRTRSPLIPRPKPGSPFDLHVLSTPPAFVLSQDQTLREMYFRTSQRACHVSLAVEYTNTTTDNDEVNQDHSARWRTEWVGLKHSADQLIGSTECTLLSFQRPLRLRDGTRRSQRSGPPEATPRRTEKYSTAAGGLSRG